MIAKSHFQSDTPILETFGKLVVTKGDVQEVQIFEDKLIR